PAALAALLSDRNGSICRRERRAVAESAFPDLAGHVGGYAVTPASWRFGPGAEIRLPDYRFTTFTTLRARQVPPDWSPSDFAGANRLDCSRWGVSCEELVGELNPKLLKQDKVARATVPVAGYATEIEIGYARDSQYAKGLDKRRLPAPGRPEQQTAWSEAFTAFAVGSNLTDLVLDALGSNVIVVGDVNDFSHTEEPLFGEQVDLFRLISHPFGASSELAAPYRHPVSVLVLDAPFEGRHCDLALGPAPEAADETASTGACDEIAAQPNPISDHAPHIIGLINAPINHKGIAGLNPFSAVTFQPINKAFSAEDDLLDAQTKLQAGAIGGARVANLSWGFETLQDGQQAFAFAVDALHKKMLVVAAAGNHGRDLSENCVWIPACLHELPNVVTVVGLDRDPVDPHLWSVEGQGSNSNGAFHIAAIADGVLSAVAGNRLGKLSGTSQAAPQVTATASLIYSAAEDIYPELTAGRQRLAPKIVKDRLIYSTDLFRGLQTKVLGGRLNVDRAIRIVDTQLVLRRASQEGGQEAIERASGNLIQFPTGEMVICLSPDGHQVGYHWSTIRRLSYDPDRKRYVIFRHAAPPNDPSNRNDYPLQRINDCNMITRNNDAVLATDRGDVMFLLKEVLDYTSPLLE
ncbi:MAG: hypothetical protein K0S21_2260, partial [Rhizobiaceae bacterium]|nr:hypothetical protein [Rhizobiaceae bacterium]